MRKIIRRVDPGFVVVLAISLIAIWPFLSRASLPEGTDAELHIFRLAELSYLLRGGEIFPRWAPNFYHGYGYPIFNFYAPLTYYLGIVPELTPWADAVAAVKVVFILGLLLGGFGMYGFVRDNWGRRAGYVAAAVFLYAPYIQYIDPLVRGVLPETFSFGVFAVALWALDRLRRTGGRWPWLISVLLVAAVILSHNLMGLLFFGLLVAWATWLLIFEYRTASERRLFGWRLFPALLLGLGVAAAFWLPVFLERDAVNLNTLIGQQDNYDFHTHFLSLREMLSPSLLLDWGATEPDFRFNLGIAQWLLGGLGLVLLLARKVRQGRHLAFFAVALVVLLFMMLPMSTIIWETIPFLPFFQFPWRLLGAVAAMLAILAGAGTVALSDLLWPSASEEQDAGAKNRLKDKRAWLAAVLVAFPIILGLPLSQPRPWPDFGEVNHLRMTLIENTGRWLGTTSTADYVPATVDTIPSRKGSVVAPFAVGRPPDRVNYATLPDGATVETKTVRPLLTRYSVNTPKPMPLRLYQFDFPGWQARVDGQPVEKELGRPEGFLIIPVPAGEHVVEVEFGSTPARNLAWAISLFSLAVMALIAWRLPRSPGLRSDMTFRDWPTLIVVLFLSALMVLIFEPAGILHYNSSGKTAEPAQVPVYADFGEQVALLGYDRSNTSAAAGESIYLTLYWKAQQPLQINYQVFIHVLGPDGLVAQSDKLNPGDFPSRRWPDDKYVRDEHEILLPPDLPPGQYEIATGVWVQSDGWRLPVLDGRGEQVGDRFTLFNLEATGE
ncbi:MAG: hypothetical protein GWP61_06930 [Chloroflexi bacterium]|jgi:hypothetical protein|nr:hypothetical protein [Chloroflexota bacterium]